MFHSLITALFSCWQVRNHHFEVTFCQLDVRMSSALVYWRRAAGKKSGFWVIPDFHSFFSEILGAGALFLQEITKNFLGSAGKNQGRSGDRKQSFFFF